MIGVVSAGFASTADARPIRYELAPPIAVPAWVTRAGALYLRDDADCLPVTVRDAARGLLRVAVGADGDRQCTVDLALTDGALALVGGGWTGPDRTEGQFAVALPPLWVVVQASEAEVTFRVPVRVTATIRDHVDVGPCSAESLAAIRSEVGKRHFDAWLADHDLAGVSAWCRTGWTSRRSPRSSR
ncbi:MAG: hypothetical protein ABMB14_26340 [Myxococcota bacterium]